MVKKKPKNKFNKFIDWIMDGGFDTPPAAFGLLITVVVFIIHGISLLAFNEPLFDHIDSIWKVSFFVSLICMELVYWFYEDKDRALSKDDSLILHVIIEKSFYFFCSFTMLVVPALLILSLVGCALYSLWSYLMIDWDRAKVIIGNVATWLWVIGFWLWTNMLKYKKKKCK